MKKIFFVGMLLGSLTFALSAFAGGMRCPDGSVEGKSSDHRVHCIDNGTMSCPEGYTMRRFPGRPFQCLATHLGTKCDAAKGEVEVATPNHKHECMAKDYAKCPRKAWHIDEINKEFKCVSPNSMR